MMLRLTIVAGGALTLVSCGQVAPTCPTVTVDPQLQVPASTIAPLVSYSWPTLNAATTSAPDGVMVSMVASQGTVAYGGRGPFPAFVYANEGLAPNSADTLYAGLGVEGGVWFPFWLYCTSDRRLTAIFGEMSDQDTEVYLTVEGTCTTQGVVTSNPFSVPAHELSPIALTCGFTVSAPAPDTTNITSSSVGSIGSTYFLGSVSSVYPFHVVDCQTCGSPGWYELHSIFWNPTAQTASFEIVYLYDTGVVEIGSQGIELPSGATSGFGATINGATWSLNR